MKPWNLMIIAGFCFVFSIHFKNWGYGWVGLALFFLMINFAIYSLGYFIDSSPRPENYEEQFRSKHDNIAAMALRSRLRADRERTREKNRRHRRY